MRSLRVVAPGGDAARWLFALALVLGVLGMHSLVADTSTSDTIAAVGVEIHPTATGAGAAAPVVSAHGMGTDMAMGCMAMGCVAVLAAAVLALLALACGAFTTTSRRCTQARAPAATRLSPPGAPSLLQLSIQRV